MKIRKLYTFAVLIMLFILILEFLPGCVSMQELPEPRSMDDTLFVVPVLVIDAKTAPFQGNINYKIILENVKTGDKRDFYVYSNRSHGYNYVRGFPEGEYLVKEYTTVGMADNDAKSIKLDNYLIVEKGKLTIFPGKLVIFIYNYKNEEKSAYIYPQFRDIDEKQMERMLNFLKNEVNYNLWEK